jgi:hydrogenase maturation protease
LPKVLIIGYGNSLRGDDNVGCHVAQMLNQHYQADPEVRVIGSHQLTPEMAEDIAASEFVLFLDAAAGEPAGNTKTVAVNPQPGPASFAHHLNPALLLAAAMELYGSAPPAQLLTMVGGTFEFGERLSPVVTQRLPAFFAEAHALVESNRGSVARPSQRDALVRHR